MVNRKMRDDFTQATKHKLAGRVGWRCAFSGCGVPTIGPQLGAGGVLITGKAAHITAAAPEGPRYDPTLTPAQRRHADNGVWMCANHADIIDKDHRNYSVETLRQFRTLAETAAHEAVTLPQPRGAQPPLALTLVGIGFDVIFEGIWVSAPRQRWRFRVHRFVFGDFNTLQRYIETFPDLPANRQFIAVEVQGDGRVLTEAPEWALEPVQGRDELFVTLPVQPLPERRDPATLGTDLAWRNGDFALDGGRLGVVSGVDNAVQKLTTLVNTPIGGLFYAEEYGVRWRDLALGFGHDLALLGRLLRLDLARVISAPIHSTEFDRETGRMVPVLRPQIDFVERVEGVEVLELNAERTRARVRLHVAWVSGERWVGELAVGLYDRPEFPRPPSVQPGHLDARLRQALAHNDPERSES